MTQPAEPTSPIDAVGLAFTLTTGPDGRVWPTWQFRTLTMTTAIQLPPEQAVTIAEAVLAETRAATHKAKQHNREALAGITIPDAKEIEALTPRQRRH